MSSLNHDQDARGVQMLLDFESDLTSQSFLLLRTTGEDFHGSSEFRQANHPAVLRLVRDVCHPTEWEEVMFAHAGEGDIRDDHRVLTVLLKLSSEVGCG